jgi:uncharacterized protein (DUF2235 family)
VVDKKRLVVCCDGTWNDADSGTDFTNVARLAWAIEPVDIRTGQEIPQIVYYQSGVGSGGDLINRAVGGGIGAGLSRNVRDAYSFLSNNYCDGDEIFLFGFSRGAYTARSISGLIGYAGLLHKRDMDRFANLWEGYRLRDKLGQADPRLQFADRHSPVGVKCVGVWDTVGALGIPGHLDKVFISFYEFHDTDLGAHVENAFHALALDETRDDFKPTLWVQDPAIQAKGQLLKQVWFAGVHSNVGGGYEEHGLSDIAQAWMASEIDPLLAVDVGYLKSKRDLRNDWSLGKLYDSAGPEWKLLGTSTRSPFAAVAGGVTNESIHPSVAQRSNAGGAAVPGPYNSAALKGVDMAARLGVLSAIENGLKWSAQDVRPAPPEQKTKFSPKGFFLKTFGAG